MCAILSDFTNFILFKFVFPANWDRKTCFNTSSKKNENPFPTHRKTHLQHMICFRIVIAVFICTQNNQMYGKQLLHCTITDSSIDNYALQARFCSQCCSRSQDHISIKIWLYIFCCLSERFFSTKEKKITDQKEKGFLQKYLGLNSFRYFVGSSSIFFFRRTPKLFLHRIQINM